MLAGSGNVMRDMNLGESLRLSFGKYADLPDFASQRREMWLLVAH